MPRAVNSFDVFDTLLARRCGEPASVLRLLETKTGRDGVAAARAAADARLWSGGKPYQLRDIWKEVARTLGLSAEEADRLMALEIELEHDESIPISQNLALVKDGDILVSDTYLPTEIVHSLLRQAGLDKEVALVVSNHGKSSGNIWPEIVSRVSIREHFGDNPHSDGETPSRAGIRAVIYTGAQRTEDEERLSAAGWESLACLAREVRLANPYSAGKERERCLWDLACQLNFPLLVLASQWMEQYLRDAALGEVLFVSRDCRLWKQLHQRLYPDRPCRYLYASRACQFRPSEGYLTYFRSVWHPESVIVDLSSTGTSWAKFFSRLGMRANCFFIIHIDDFAYTRDRPLPKQWLEITSILRSSRLGVPFSKGLEMLNYAPHPVVEDVVVLPGEHPLPVLADQLEYEAALPEAASSSFRACLARLRSYPLPSEARHEDLIALITHFVRLISAEQRLGVLYPGHQAADEAYVGRVLG